MASKIKSYLWVLLICSIIVRYSFSLSIAPNLFLSRFLIPLLSIFTISNVIQRLFGKKKIYFKIDLIILYSIITILWSINIHNYLIGLIYLISNILVFILADVFVYRYDILENTIKAMYVTFIISLVVGIYEILTWTHLPSSKYSVEYTWNIKIATSFFYNPNEFGIFIVLMLPIVYYFYLSSKTTFYKIINIFVILTSFFVLFYTNSRLSMIIAIVGIFIYKYLYDWFFKSKTYSYYVRSTLGKLALVLIIVILIINYEKIGIDNLRVFQQISSVFKEFGNSDNSLAIRKTIVLTAFNIAINSFGAGIGLGQLSEYIPSYNWLIVSTNVHSYFLKIFSEIGIIGLFLILSIIFEIIRGLIIVIIRSDNSKMKLLSFSLMNSIIFLIFAGFGAETVHLNSIIWLTFGVSYATIRINRKVIGLDNMK